MPILSAGLSYRRAPVALLERLSFQAEDLPKAYHHLDSLEDVRGAVILSTCNRVEVVADVDSYHSGLQALRGFLADSREVPVEELDRAMTALYEEPAVQHLFALASGIDSMVVGEPQILSQVRDAFRRADAERAVTPFLHAVLRRAIRVGRRVRSETGIEASPTAMVDAGAGLAEEALGPLDGLKLLVVGAGMMAELAVRAFGTRGVKEVTVLNRSLSRAERLARLAGGAAGELAGLEDAISQADLVVTFTGASGIVVERGPVERGLGGREGRPMFVLDLAVPRDVDPDVGSLPGVTLVDIDALKGIVNGTESDEVERAQAIVDEELARFVEWRKAARLAPLIQALYDRAESIRAAELSRVLARLDRLSEEERAAVEAATAAIVKKLLHRPVVRAKQDADDDALVRSLARLFDLEAPPPA